MVLVAPVAERTLLVCRKQPVQFEMDVEPWALQSPVGQGEQTAPFLYWPAGHRSRQEVDEPSLYLFAGQSTQVSVTPSMKNWLVPQQTLVVDEVQRANVPLAHGVVVPHEIHAVFPAFG